MTSTSMLHYRRQGDIDYAALDFDPDVSVEKPEPMEQHPPQSVIYTVLRDWFVDFHRRPDVFVDFDSNICYDRSNLNVRVSPDVYVALGVDAAAIMARKLYLPWEAGKPPDWVLEIASESTWQEDVYRKPAVYARIGVPEYWRFDPTGSIHYGYPLAGERLVNGVYQPIELTSEPDGVLKGYSDVLGLSLCWDEGRARIYNPETGTYLANLTEARVARADAEDRAAAAEAELRRLREQLRDQQSR